jgi:hypothetical protein
MRRRGRRVFGRGRAFGRVLVELKRCARLEGLHLDTAAVPAES